MAQTHQGRIPDYNLYGELAELPDVLHCETILARASLHDWNIGAHRHSRLHQFFAITSGSGVVEIDGRAIGLEPPMVINMPPLAVHRFEFAVGTQGLVITMPVELFEAEGGRSQAVLALLHKPGVATADPATVALMEEIAAEHAGSGFGRAHVLQAAAALAMARIARLLRPVQPARDETTGSSQLRRFEMLIEQHFRRHWKVADYARELGISPTHLSRLARAGAGRPASALIDARLMREARRALAYTNMTVAQIAYETGFEDPAYFTRAFRRASGMSPSAYRQRLHAPRGAAAVKLPQHS